jgi:hypothetical protein
VSHLPGPVHDAYLAGFSGALTTVFLVAAAVSVLAFALTWVIREVPLRTTVRDAPPPPRAEPAGEPALGSPAPQH